MTEDRRDAVGGEDEVARGDAPLFGLDPGFFGSKDSRLSTTARLVKPLQYRGAGVSGVYLDERRHWDGSAGRVYVKRQHAYTCRPAWRGFRRTPTLARELRALRAMHTLGIAAPEVIAYRTRGLSAELVVTEIDGVPLADALMRPDAPRERILSSVAELIARLHHHGWVHGALNAEHIFLQPGERAALIDFEKARRSRRLIGADLARIWRRNPVLGDADRNVFERAYRSADVNRKPES